MSEITMAALVDRLRKWYQKAPEIAKRALLAGADVVIGVSRAQFFARGVGSGGPLLHVRSGRLWRSLHKTAEVSGGEVRAYVGSNVVYARIHEKGGTIRPVRGMYLTFPVTGSRATVSKSGKYSRKRVTLGWVRTRQVNMPARPYLVPALQEARPQMRATIAAVMAKGYREAQEMIGG